jgi:hypothetical protein
MLISEMKLFARKILWFALFFVLFNVLINTIFLVLIALTDWDFVKRRESLNFDNPSYKVLVLGTSLAEYGVDTELLTENDFESYNLAFVGSSIKTNYIQLDEYLSKYNNKPRYVILGLNSALENFTNDGIQPVIEFTMAGHRYNIKDLPISKFNWAGMELLKKLVKTKYRQTYLSLGQKKCAYNVPDISRNGDNVLDLGKYSTARWIGEISKLCADHDVELILLEMPGIKETQNISPVGPYDITFSEGGHAVLYNFNNSDFCGFIDCEKDWAGLSHFNRFGAEKFTSEIITRVFSHHPEGQ